jgi:hypothetical protein
MVVPNTFYIGEWIPLKTPICKFLTWQYQRLSELRRRFLEVFCGPQLGAGLNKNCRYNFIA